MPRFTLFLISNLTLAISIVVTGGCLMVLWNWFIPPIFIGAPQLNLVSSMGIYLAIACLVKPGLRHSCPEWSEISAEEGLANNIFEHCSYGIATPLSCLFAGWIVHCI